MENDWYIQKQQLLNDCVLNKQFDYKKEYDEQTTNYFVKKWKSDILKKFGNGGQFYFCEKDGLYYYADKDEAIIYKQCPKCRYYCCPFCNRNTLYNSQLETCCIKGSIKYMFIYNIYDYISPKNDHMKNKKIPKPLILNYGQRGIFLILYVFFMFFISIPYFFHHYIFISILLITSIFNKKLFLKYCGIVDRGLFRW